MLQDRVPHILALERESCLGRFQSVVDQRLAALVESLSAVQRDALRWRYLEGRPVREIAARLGKKEGAVRVTQHFTAQFPFSS